MPSRRAVLDYLFSLQGRGIKPGLGRIEAILKRLGNPERDFPSIHIGGTNGKGSTAAFLASILDASGLKSGLYTSPHLVRFNERIRIGSRLITDSEIIGAARAIKRAASRLKEDLSFFEFTTAMAFLHFREKKADIAVIEVGMGGRWDATNVVAPLVSIITSVGLDHTEFLGGTVAEIASEKAGIIKEGVPVITAEEKPAALRVIRKQAQALKAPLLGYVRDFYVSPSLTPGLVDYRGAGREVKNLRLSLAGTHQHKNAACALAAVELLNGYGYKIPVRSVRAGLKCAEWPGRVEAVRKRPLVILDCAHNPEGAATLRDALGLFSYRKLILVLGIMADKDIGGILKNLAPMASTIVLASPETQRAASAAWLKEKARGFGKRLIMEPSVKEACKRALEEAGVTDAVCITGSIFTVGEAKVHLPRILRQTS